MQFLTTIIALAACTISTAAPTALVTSDLVPTAENAGIATFVGEINGTPFSMEGLATDVLAAIEAQHPGYLATQPPLAERAAITLNRRNKDGFACMSSAGNYKWQFAYISSMKAIADGLRQASLLTLYVPAKQCHLLDCWAYDGEGGIDGAWLCNDNDYKITPQAEYIASYIDDTATSCMRPSNHLETGGQEFDTDHYNVLVRDCCNPDDYPS